VDVIRERNRPASFSSEIVPLPLNSPLKLL
jgi:hypothetical protein